MKLEKIRSKNFEEAIDNKAIREAEKSFEKRGMHEKNSIYNQNLKDMDPEDINTEEILQRISEGLKEINNSTPSDDRELTEEEKKAQKNEFLKKFGLYQPDIDDIESTSEVTSIEDLKETLKKDEEKLKNISEKLDNLDTKYEKDDINDIDFEEIKESKSEEVINPDDRLENENIEIVNEEIKEEKVNESKSEEIKDGEENRKMEEKVPNFSAHSEMTNNVDTTSGTTNTNSTNIQKEEINFEDLIRRINNFENIDKLKDLDISVENFEELKNEIIEDELALLESIGEELHEMKEKIEDEEKRLNQRTQELPKEIEEATAREAQLKEEFEKLEQEFNNLSEEDPEYANKENMLKEKSEELKEASSTLSNLKSEQENLKTDYEKLNENKLKYKDSYETYENRINISFDVINKFNPEKAQQISNMKMPEEIAQNEQQVKDEQNEIKWHKDLTEEQIDEMKAECIEPGSPEYDRYLADHGIKNAKEEQEKAQTEPEEIKQEENVVKDEQDVKQQVAENEPVNNGYNDSIVNDNMHNYSNNVNISQQEQKVQTKEAEPEWHKDLTQDQIDEMKAECINPGDPEYSQYLAEHGIKENSEKQQEQPAEEVKEELETALTDPKKENKIKLFFRKFKEKIQSILNKNVSEQEIQELANEIEVQGIDEGTEFREQCARGARNMNVPEQLREIIESEEIRKIKEAPSKEEQAIGAI